MAVEVQRADGSYRVAGDWDGAEAANAFLAHLSARAFSPATIRAYAFDLVNFARFLIGQGRGLAAVSPVDVFAWVDWQGARRHGRTETVATLRPRHASAATVNRRVAAVRAFFEYLVMAGACPDNPVPSPRRGQGLRPAARGLLGHLGSGRPRGGGRLVRQPRRLPESLAAGDVEVFVASLRTHRDRAMVLAMLLGGLRSAEAVDAFDTGLAASMTMPRSSVRAHRCRLAACARSCSRPGSPMPRPGAARGRGPWRNGSPTCRSPPRSARCCCDTCTPGHRRLPVVPGLACG